MGWDGGFLAHAPSCAIQELRTLTNLGPQRLYSRKAQPRPTQTKHNQVTNTTQCPCLPCTELMSLKQRFEEDRKRVVELRAIRNFKPT